MSFNQYLKDTRVELKHVAWPTQLQTLVYTTLVIGISIAIGLYIGFFDFFFTRGLEEFLHRMGATTAPIEINQQPVDTNTPVNFDVLPGGAKDSVAPITNEAAPKAN
ncbi:MAG: preprotein translocase subunit SecE [Parcubacteria group bacterium]|nr:preprotein translocase subunit SecE [Parcubacteria group bacterium]